MFWPTNGSRLSLTSRRVSNTGNVGNVGNGKQLVVPVAERAEFSLRAEFRTAKIPSFYRSRGNRFWNLLRVIEWFHHLLADLLTSNGKPVNGKDDYSSRSRVEVEVCYLFAFS